MVDVGLDSEGKARGSKRPRIKQKYEWNDKGDVIGEGTYGLVFRAKHKQTNKRVAVKKFKNTKEGEGISITACREIMLLRELAPAQHPNIVSLEDIFLSPQDKSLYMVFEFADYNLFDIIRYHQDQKSSLDLYTVKSIMWQMLNGIHCLHANWIMHRDIKPSNILVMGEGKEVGIVKIADFGLARIFQSPLRSLSENGVVVTIWYRAPELLLGAKHYTRAVDIWAIGCIFAELMASKPLFPGKEKDPQNPNLFQTDQVEKIFRVLGKPSPDVWPDVVVLPEWKRVQTDFPRVPPTSPEAGLRQAVPGLRPDTAAYDLLVRMLCYDPTRRITAEDALEHPYFKESPLPHLNIFWPPNGRSKPLPYPKHAPSTQQQHRQRTTTTTQQWKQHMG